MSEELSTREKLVALREVASYRPVLTVGIIGLSFFAAILEGVGLSFLLPIIETAQSSGGRRKTVSLLHSLLSTNSWVFRSRRSSSSSVWRW
jgi:hypothetical protein